MFDSTPASSSVPFADFHPLLACAEVPGPNHHASQKTHTETRPGSDESIRESEQHYRQAFQLLPTAIYTCDIQGRITLYNRAAARLWGREPVIGQDLWCGSWKIYRSDGSQMPFEKCPMGVALREGRAVEGQEIIIERPDGTRSHVMPHPQPIRNEEGRVIGAINLLLDITERRRAETELADAKDDLARQVMALQKAKELSEEANRSKDRFLAVLSHELRTPLAPVLMAASAMEKNAELPFEVRNDAAMICASVRLGTKLIDDLLDLSRITNGKLRLQLESVDLNDTVLDVCEICRTQFREKKIQLRCDFDESVGRVSADPARLQQVLWNVLNNAAKFTAEGGHVFVKTSYDGKGRMQVQVKDTGIGIAEAQLSRIFNAFEQGSEGLPSDTQGLGLGLAISKALVELHRGCISAHSDGLSMGSTFTIELREEASIARNSRPSVMSSTADQLKGLQILIVEDHPDTGQTLARCLRMSGCAVTLARSAAEALSHVSTQPFDLLLSDIGLPDMSGYELMQKIKTRHAIKGIALSGYGMDDDIHKSQAAGFSEHLVKPVDLGHLERAICRIASEKPRAPESGMPDTAFDA